jgi:hypothetical protein
MNLEGGLEEIRALHPGASSFVEQGRRYIHLPALKLRDQSDIREALLCLDEHSGYPTRLFLDAPVAGKGTNWSSHQILDRLWHSWSWNYITADRSPMEILANHVRALQ